MINDHVLRYLVLVPMVTLVIGALIGERAGYDRALRDLAAMPRAEQKGRDDGKS